MNQTTIFFQLLAKKFTGKLSCASFLPTSQKETLDKEESYELEPKELIFSPQTWLFLKHPSWYQESLKKMPLPIQKIVTPLLTHAVPEKRPLSFSQKFAISYFFTHGDNTSFIPSKMVGKTALSPLLTLTYKELIQVLYLVALHPLADLLKRIVDRNILQAIMGGLTIHERKYLTICSRQRLTEYPNELSLRKLLEKKSDFRNSLQKVGMKIFAQALPKTSPIFTDFVLHLFNKNRGEYIANLMKNEQSAEGHLICEERVLHAIQFIKTIEHRE